MDLQPGEATFKANLELGGQSIPLGVKTSIKEENGAWAYTETVTTPQGDIVDVSTIEKGTLLLKRRVIKQGPITVEFDVKGSKITGTTGLSGPPKPIDVDLGGSYYSGSAAFEALAALPLAEGYSATYLDFDEQKLKPRTKLMKVLGMESVTVPAGTFNAFKIDIQVAEDEADKQTIWIDKASRKIVKITATLPSLGGAVLTSELQP